MEIAGIPPKAGQGLLHLRGKVVELASGEFALVCRADAKVWTLDADEPMLSVCDAETGERYTVEVIAVVDSAIDTMQLVPPKRGGALLAEFIRADPDNAGFCLGAPGQPDLASRADHAATLNELTSGLAGRVPIFVTPDLTAIRLVQSADLADFTPVWLAGVRAMQGEVDRVYGRLEPERALVWAFEELAELAQAYRKGYGRGRLHEELGQVFIWSLCLGNVMDVDVAEAARRALGQEVLRQHAKYGRLKPYIADRGPS